MNSCELLNQPKRIDLFDLLCLVDLSVKLQAVHFNFFLYSECE